MIWVIFGRVGDKETAQTMTQSNTPGPITNMDTLHRTVNTPEGDGIITWVEDEDVAVLLDDGQEYIFNQSEIADSTTGTAKIRQSYWEFAHRNEDDFFEACKLYSRVVKRWTTMVKNAGKTCSKCNRFKPFDDFHASVDSADGVRPDCKQCRKAA